MYHNTRRLIAKQHLLRVLLISLRGVHGLLLHFSQGIFLVSRFLSVFPGKVSNAIRLPGWLSLCLLQYHQQGKWLVPVPQHYPVSCRLWRGHWACCTFPCGLRGEWGSRSHLTVAVLSLPFTSSLSGLGSECLAESEKGSGRGKKRVTVIGWDTCQSQCCCIAHQWQFCI